MISRIQKEYRNNDIVILITNPVIFTELKGISLHSASSVSEVSYSDSALSDSWSCWCIAYRSSFAASWRSVGLLLCMCSTIAAIQWAMLLPYEHLKITCLCYCISNWQLPADALKSTMVMAKRFWINLSGLSISWWPSATCVRRSWMLRMDGLRNKLWSGLVIFQIVLYFLAELKHKVGLKTRDN